MKFVVLHQLPFCGFKGPLYSSAFISLSHSLLSQLSTHSNIICFLFFFIASRPLKRHSDFLFTWAFLLISDHRAADIILLPFQVRPCLIILTSIYVCCFVGMFLKFDRFITFCGFSTLKVESGYFLPIHGQGLNKTKEQPAINNSQL
jgi:hypothetical protein